jgi:hypothetical protein
MISTCGAESSKLSLSQAWVSKLFSGSCDVAGH